MKESPLQQGRKRRTFLHTAVAGTLATLIPSESALQQNSGPLPSTFSSLKPLGSRVIAISNEESRYTLNGALLVLKPESITMVATDGHRLAHIAKEGVSFDIAGEMKTLVPRKAMAELLTLLGAPDIDFVEFAKDDSTLFFRLGSRLLTSRQLTGQFPNYEAVLPKEHNKSVTVRTEDLHAAIQRVAQFADERSGAIKMRFEHNELRISSSSTETGESEDSIETAYREGGGASWALQVAGHESSAASHESNIVNVFSERF
jgi:DNA polymerase-3 subunit beta